MNSGQHQSGAVLIISLIILLTLTVLGLSSMRTTTMEELMARNTRDYKIAFEGADSAATDGRSVVQASITEPADCALGSTCGAVMSIYKKNTVTAAGDLGTQNSAWWITNRSKAFLTGGGSILDPGQATGTGTIGVNDPSQVTDVTFIPDTLVRGHKYTKIPGKHIYRVSSRGTGLSDSTHVIVQQTVAKRFN